MDVPKSYRKCGFSSAPLIQLKDLQTDTLSFSCKICNLACCCSVAGSCPTLCNPMGYSTPGFPVLYHLPEFAQTHVHWVGDAIQPSSLLLSPSPPAFNLSQHQGLFQWVSSSPQVTKVPPLHQEAELPGKPWISFTLSYFTLPVSFITLFPIKLIYVAVIYYFKTEMFTCHQRDH